MKASTLNHMFRIGGFRWAAGRAMAAWVASGVLLASLAGAAAQSQVLVDPAKPWAGFMNVFSLPADGGAYQFGSPWGAADLRAAFSGDLLTLRSCTNVSNPADPYWVKPDGSGNKKMSANWYVENDTLLSSNVVFSGNVVDFGLTTNYTCTAFVKVFDGSYNTLQQATVQLTNGNSFFSLSITANAAGAAHVQYGFTTEGPNAPWTNSPDSEAFITIRANALNPTNALVNPGFENGLVGWTAYGNGGNIETAANLYYNGNNPVGASNVLVYEGVRVQKVYPQFTGGANYSGVYQDVPTGAGSVWSASARYLTHIQDWIGVWEGAGTNQCWLEVTFRDASDNVLATYTSASIENGSPSNTWIAMVVTNELGGTTFTAPAGTTKARLQEVYYQPYGYAGGSVYVDQMVLNNLSPSDPNITTLPISQTKLVGESVSFTVVATGATALSYQWKTNGVPLVNGGRISGATSSTLTIVNLQKSDATTYTVDVTDDAGTLSASATLTVKTALEAANLLENPSFETGLYPPFWTKFNGGSLKMNDEFWSGITVTNYDGVWGSVVENGGEYNGVFQDVPATPGQIFVADGWFFEPSPFPLTEGNQVWLEVQFRAGATPIALYKSAIIGTNDPARPMDTWYNLTATNGFAGDFVTPIPNAYYLVAPPNTTTIRYQITMRVQGGAGGILYDALSLMAKIPVTVTAGTSGGNLNLSWTSQAGTSYQVVYKDNLTDATWTPVGGLIAGNGAVVSAPPISTAGSQRFYSVLTK
jgi:hypothetical protein